jgi:hypothetical protein
VRDVVIQKEKSTDRELEAAAVEALLEEEAKQEQERTLDDEEFRQILAELRACGLVLDGEEEEDDNYCSCVFGEQSDRETKAYFWSLGSGILTGAVIGFYLTMHLFW